MSKFYEKAYEFDEFETEDYMIALQLQMQMDVYADDDDVKIERDEKNDYNNKQLVGSPLSSTQLTDPQWDLIDPCPDIRAMFVEFNKKYFWNSLGSCLVEWSKRMTICAGIFYLREGGIIRLSEPLLKYRPRKDLVETLLHEMIHAYLYITRNFKDRGEHGDEFKSHMNRINKLANTKITVYHSFHDEVNHCRQHVWRCTGVCRTMPPFYGYVKRSMNRAPGKNDTWWSSHQAKCNGHFEKISEPEAYTEKMNKTLIKKEKKMNQTLNNTSTQSSSQLSKSKLASSQSSSQATNSTNSLNRIDKYFANKADIIKKEEKQMQSQRSQPQVYEIDDFPLKALTTNTNNSITVYFNNNNNKNDSNKIIEKSSNKKIENDIIILDDDDNEPDAIVRVKIEGNKKHANSDLVQCPVCFEKFAQSMINAHVNSHF